MISESIIVIPFNTKKYWQADYIQQTCKVLSKKNKIIAFLWADSKSFKEIIIDLFIYRKKFKFIEIRNNILYFTPIHFLPFRRFGLVERINYLINIFFLKIYTQFFFKGYRKYLWIFHPDFHKLINYFSNDFISIYDCVDYFSSPNYKINNRFRMEEEQLITKCNFVFTNSNVLYNKLKYLRKDINLIPQGFAYKSFKKYKIIKLDKLIIPTNKPLIGFIGGINSRINYNLLRKLVVDLKSINFIFIGSKQPSFNDKYIGKIGYPGKFFSFSNVIWIDNQPKEYIQAIIELFDIAIIPYNTGFKFNKYCYPMKLFEYFYMGKPVVSTPIEELKRFPKYVKIGKDVEEWEIIIKKLLSKPWPKKYREEQRKLAIDNSWEKKIEAISRAILNNQSR